MVYVMLAIRDDKVECFVGKPFTARNVPDGLRAFTDGLTDGESMMSKHPDHFSLWLLGSWDAETGELVAKPKSHIASGIDLVNKGG